MLILHRYIFRGMMPPLLVNLLFLTLIFLMTRMLQITELIVNHQVGFGTIGLILMYSIPHFLVFVLPMAVMLAILLNFMRMAGDNEIIALKSGGVSLYRLLPPALILAVGGFVATLIMTIYGMPNGKLAIARVTYQMLANNTDIGLKPRTFYNRFKGVTLYVNAVNLQDKRLQDVFIEDRRNRRAVSTIVAPEGRLLKDDSGAMVRLRLYDGIINQVTRAKRTANTIHFKTYDVNLDLTQVARLERYKRKDEDEMNLTELRRHILEVRDRPEKYHEALIELHQKFSIPAACLALGLLAVPLGVELRSTRQSAGLGVGLFVFILYYVLMTAGRVFGEMGLVHPAVGLWAPNAVMGLGGFFMLVRSAKEESTYLIPALRYMAGRLRQVVVARWRRLPR
jgi:lipopolysaccharide export system permease protein